MLETARLRLRPVEPGDQAFFHRQWNEAEVGRFLWDGAPVSAATVAEVLAGSADSFAETGYGLWHVSLREDGRALGFCGLRVAETGRVELLYALDPAAWGLGYATEASRAVLAYAFGVLGLEAVTASTNPANAPSWRVLEKLGMAVEGRRRTDIEELVDDVLTRGVFEKP